MELFSKPILEKWKEVDPVGWRSIVLDILDAFAKTSTAQLDAFKKALAVKDQKLSHIEAHSLKSCYGNVGALLIQSQFASIEKSIETANWSQAENFFNEVELNLSETHRLINEYKNSLLQLQS